MNQYVKCKKIKIIKGYNSLNDKRLHIRSMFTYIRKYESISSKWAGLAVSPNVPKLFSIITEYVSGMR